MGDGSQAERRIDRNRALGMALALIACTCPATAASPAGQVVVPAPPLAPDYTAVTSRKEAAKLVRKRLLVKIHFFPVELGGPRARINIGYVTPEAATSHALLTEMLARYGERGLIDRLEIVPEYKGESIVPTRLRLTAWHARGGERFERVIEVWNCGLCLPLDPLPDPDAPRQTTA